MDKYKHEVAVLDSGELEPRCFKNRELCWRGQAQSQSEGVGRAHAAAALELNSHVQETGHVSFKQRHGGKR